MIDTKILGGTLPLPLRVHYNTTAVIIPETVGVVYPSIPNATLDYRIKPEICYKKPNRDSLLNTHLHEAVAGVRHALKPNPLRTQ